METDLRIEKFIQKLENEIEKDDFSLNSFANMEYYLRREEKFDQLLQIYDLVIQSPKLSNEDKAEVLFSKYCAAFEQGNTKEAQLFYNQGLEALKNASAKRKEVLFAFAKAIVEKDLYKTLEYLRDAIYLTKDKDPIYMKLLTRLWRTSSKIFETISSNESVSFEEKFKLGKNTIELLESIKIEAQVISEYYYFIYASFLYKNQDKNAVDYFKKSESLSKTSNSEIYYSSMYYLLAYYFDTKNEKETESYVDKIKQLFLNEKQQTQFDSILVPLYFYKKEISKSREILQKLLGKQLDVTTLTRLLCIKISLDLLEKDFESPKLTIKKLKAIPEVFQNPNATVFFKVNIFKVELFEEFKNNEQVFNLLSQVLYEENAKDFEKAFKYGDEALNLIPNTFSKFKLYYLNRYFIVNSHLDQDQEKQIESYQKDCEYLSKIKNFIENELEEKEFSEIQLESISDIYYSLSNRCLHIYGSEKGQEQSVKVLESFLSFLKENFEIYLSTLNDIAMIYIDMKNYEKALSYLHKILEKTDNTNIKIDTLMNIGITTSYSDAEKAYQYFDEAQKLAKDSNQEDLRKKIEEYVKKDFPK